MPENIVLFVVTPQTVLNRGALAMKQVPRRFFGRAVLFPRQGGAGLWLRTIVELQAVRYSLSLLPFLIVGFTWQNTALALAQAPIFMLLLIGIVEMRVLRLSVKARAAIIAPDDRDRALDLLRVRGREILTRIAAGRGITNGALHLVVEMSPLARITPLAYVSVQIERNDARPVIMALTPEERAMLGDTLFAAPLTEETLRRVTQQNGEPILSVAFDPAQVSAHARLAALIG
jgi:hypothetical protein